MWSRRLLEFLVLAAALAVAGALAWYGFWHQP